MIALVAALAYSACVTAQDTPPPGTEVRLLLDAASRRGELLAATGAAIRPVADIATVLAGEGPRIAIVDATPANLNALAAAPEKLKAFTEARGWLMLWGLTPDGLADFNKIVGVNHLIRPFGMEEVDLPEALRAGKDAVEPLAAGIRGTDVFMESGEWSTSPPHDSACAFRAADAWTYVVDTGDIAPFCTLPGPEFWKKEDPRRDLPDWPRNMVNGLTYQWRFGFAFEVAEGVPTRWPVKFPREEEVVSFSITPWTIMSKITRLRLHFADGGKPVELKVKPVEVKQEFTFPGRRTGGLEIEIAEWDKARGRDVLGVLNFTIEAKRSLEFRAKVKPLLNIGVLVRYPMGEGGVILNQLCVPEKEQNDRNAAKKRRILSALLHNLGTI